MELLQGSFGNPLPAVVVGNVDVEVVGEE